MVGRFRQQVPRPREVGIGELPPWTRLAAETRASVPPGRVRAAFPAPFVPRNDPTVRAAVLVPIYARAGESWIVLTRRSTRLARNPGDVAFPGGHIESGETALEAALREAEEEIALPRSLVEVIGELEVVSRPNDGRHIAPFVAILANRPELVASESEVEQVIDVPLAAMMGDGVAWEERWVFEGVPRPIPFFAHEIHLGEDLIWGATGRILWALLARIGAVESPVTRHGPSERRGPLLG